jgi:hypothetical protein
VKGVCGGGGEGGYILMSRKWGGGVEEKKTWPKMSQITVSGINLP